MKILGGGGGLRLVIVLNATFNNISVKLWQFPMNEKYFILLIFRNETKDVKENILQGYSVEILAELEY